MEAIKALDLMIGNLLQDQEGNILKVIGITENDITYYVVDRSKYPLKEGWKAKPVLLTEEILLKAGFERKEDDVYSMKHGFIIHKPKSECYILRSENTNTDLWHVHVIMYLHQLQNLYKSLTWNDLNIKL